MFLSCGNRQPSDHHGNADNIVIHDLERAAEADSISVREAAEGTRRAEFGEGQSGISVSVWNGRPTPGGSRLNRRLATS